MRRRSVSDLAHHLKSCRRDPPKELNLREMVRLSGKSVLYLPGDYAPGTMVLPTCIRATAQHLAQHTMARGIFRIPGSVRIVNALFDHYCYLGAGCEDVASTVRCANLPSHIQASVHDVASTFKRLLSVLPGGILGTLSLFDAFVAIQAQLHGEPEFPRTKQTKIRARLIALAIGSIESQLRRELICAVFGLLSLIGRSAELAPREDEDSRPLPTADLMGYSALGIVFGPLLMGDLLDQYTMSVATPETGLLLFPLTPKKLRKDRRKSNTAIKPLNAAPPVNKIYIANKITEMLISNWRDIVRQMKSLGTHRKHAPALHVPGSLRPAASEMFPKSQDWDEERRDSAVQVNRDSSPSPETPPLGPRRPPPLSKRSASSNRLQRNPSGTMLSPTAEEGSDDESPNKTKGYNIQIKLQDEAGNEVTEGAGSVEAPTVEPLAEARGFSETDLRQSTPRKRRDQTTYGSPQVSMEHVPPRTSSKQGSHVDSPRTTHTSRTFNDDQVQASFSEPQATQLTNRQQGKRPSLSDFLQMLQHRPSSRDIRMLQDLEFGESLDQPHLEVPGDNELGQSMVIPNPLIKQEPRVETSRNREMDFEEFGGPKAVAKEPLAGQMTENMRVPCGPTDTHSSASYESQDQDESFYLSSNRDIEQDIRVEVPPAPKGPPDTLPRQFYAPMRVPPGLSNQKYETPFGLRDARRDSFKGWEQGTRIERRLSGQIDADESMKSNATGASEVSISSADKSSMKRPSTGAVQPIKTKYPPRTAATRFAQPREESVRNSQSEARGHHVGVRAMAAMFEEGESSKRSSKQSQNDRQRQSIKGPTPNSSGRSTRTSRSGSVWEQKPQKPDCASTKSIGSSRSSASIRSEETRPRLRASIDDGVALRAAALMETERSHQGPSTEKPPFAGLRQAPSKDEAEVCKDFRHQQQTMGGPGTMVPPQEQPPVAQYLHLPQPPSSSSSQRLEDSLHDISGTPRPNSATLLHSQIRHLQRQLNAKTEEAAHLRRQLEAVEDSDIGTLSEQLREAKREAQMWRERAEAAERRVKVFEKFTARLKGIKAAVAVAEKQSQGAHGEVYKSEDGADQSIRLLRGKHTKGQTESDHSTHTEDAGVVTARIRKCLHGQGASDTHDGTLDSLPREELGFDGSASPDWGPREVEFGAMEIWMAAQELLDMEELEGM